MHPKRISSFLVPSKQMKQWFFNGLKWLPAGQAKHTFPFHTWAVYGHAHLLLDVFQTCFTPFASVRHCVWWWSSPPSETFRANARAMTVARMTTLRMWDAMSNGNLGDSKLWKYNKISHAIFKFIRLLVLVHLIFKAIRILMLKI